MRKRVPSYYLTQQRWLLAFVALVFTGLSGAALIRHSITGVKRLLYGPPLTWHEVGEAAGPASVGVGMLALGLWFCWICIRWKKWVLHVAAADRLFGKVDRAAGNRSIIDRIARSPFDLMREKAGRNVVNPLRRKPSKKRNKQPRS
jgi:hypothetical protein